MAIGNYYLIINCTNCNWQTTHYRKSDVIFDKRDLPPENCPKCGNEHLHSSGPIFGKVNLLGSLLVSKLEQLKK